MKKNIVTDGLQGDAELIKERVPQDLTDEAVCGVVSSLRAFMRENGLSQGKTAERLGVSKTMVSDFLGKGYKGNVVKSSTWHTKYVGAYSSEKVLAAGRAFLDTLDVEQRESLMELVGQGATPEQIATKVAELGQSK